MNTHNNTYDQQPVMPPMPSMNIYYGGTKRKADMPKWITQYSVVVYITALLVVSFIYSAYSMPWYYMLSGVAAVLVFFLYGNTVIKDTSLDKIRKERRFEKRIFMIAFVPRVVWMLLIYTIFMQNYGDAFGFENFDALGYHELGSDFADAMSNGTWFEKWRKTGEVMDLSDMGYAAYLGFVYWFSGKSIIVVRLLKSLFSAWTVLLIYRLAKRNFGEQIGRMAAVFCALWPNFWYYSGCHLKETEMVFMSVLFVEQADQMLRSRQFTAWKIIPILLIGASLLTLRTPLALVAFLSLIFSVVMSSDRVVNWGKRIIVGGLSIILIAVTMGNSIIEESRGLIDTAQSGEQQENMEWRSKREHGNSFAKYAGKSVFAPLIFTIPFPTLSRPYDGQEQQQLLNGGNFVKNIMSAFTILAMFILLLSGEWRDHLLPLSFLLGYLVVLTMSTFAQSERFHQPATPFEFMFAAYGLSVAVTKPKYKRWFTYWSAFMFVAAIAWNWFKLAGRGIG